MKQYRDYPIEKCAKTVERVLQRRPGSAFYQKWTCGGCGQRVTGNIANKFFIEGHCEDCGYVTDINKTGCNYLMHFAIGGIADTPAKGSA